MVPLIQGLEGEGGLGQHGHVRQVNLEMGKWKSWMGHDMGDMGDGDANLGRVI